MPLHRNTKVLLLVVTVILIVLVTTLKVYNSNKSTSTNHGQKRHSTTRCPTCSKINPKVTDGLSTLTLSKKRPIHDRKHGYIGVLNYVGQQGSGVQALVSLQCMISSFDLPVSIPEPLLVQSKFSTFVNVEDDVEKKGGVKGGEEHIKFSDVFDIEHFNKVSKLLGFPTMAPREHFMTSAPKDIVFIDVKSVSEFAPQRQRAVKEVWTKSNSNGHPSKNKTLERMLHRFSIDTDFNVVKILQVSTYSDELHSYIMSESDLRDDILSDLALENVTIIFSTWRTLWHIVNHLSRNPHKCLGVGYGSDKEQFYPSPRLLSDADRYEEMFLSSGYNVAVMFRIERVILYIESLRGNDKKWTVDKCLDEVVKTTRKIEKYDHPMITLDLGKFASSSWYHRSQSIKKMNLSLSNKVQSKVSQLYKDHEWKLEQWEESFTKATGGVKDTGYIAALQRTLASRADCLVMVGGGSFQDLAMKDYIRNHPNSDDQCIHSVCMMAVEYVFKRLKNARA